MDLDLKIRGDRRLREVAAQIKAIGDKGLGREMAAGLRKATEPIKKGIRTSAEQTMPASGGYSALLSKSLRWRVNVRPGARIANVTLTTTADGTKEKRDLGRLEAGELRHPVWGRSRKLKSGKRKSNPWATTTIRAGFHKRGTDKAADVAEKEMAEVLDGLAAKLAGG
ncbi:hypothetical protein GCM10010168_85830 [Actinoplanes ianthinogenes]|uniref:HK97 gp10 family phage protein n=1 Tax=Actinoplanes ianthinogenes TaxID=122358 RepID=A0ABM7M188_9ACTN|nr:hypothetical protein [Actinoplanes ianthinogenes]BCJ45314.1 hypothetical protein Aiant_59710 [Actinoplanes ianthinogenes]GGR53729.1 hypothetical protein GCM10010168_85830 [Actinoplanes ianthinogenes]